MDIHSTSFTSTSPILQHHATSTHSETSITPAVSPSLFAQENRTKPFRRVPTLDLRKVELSFSSSTSPKSSPHPIHSTKAAPQIHQASTPLKTTCPHPQTSYVTTPILPQKKSQKHQAPRTDTTEQKFLEEVANGHFAKTDFFTKK